MHITVLIIRLLLALVFVTSGMAKLRDQRGTGKAMRDFGVPGPLVRFTSLFLPVLELAMAALLIPSTTYWWGALGVLLLLLVFIAAMGYQLANGRHPDCNCFGELGSGPIGRATLFRNGVLSVLALFLLVEGWADTRPHLPATGEGVSGLELLIVVVGMATLGLVLALATLMVLAYKQLARKFTNLTNDITAIHAFVNRRATGPARPPAVGEPAPILELPDLHGTMIDLASRRGRELLLLFVRPGCDACHALVPTLQSRDADPLATTTDLVLISRGRAEENADFVGRAPLILLSPNGTAMQAFGVTATPSALYIDADGIIASDIVVGTSAVRALLDPAPETAPHDAPDRAVNRWRRSLATSTHRAIAVLRGANT